MGTYIDHHAIVFKVFLSLVNGHVIQGYNVNLVEPSNSMIFTVLREKEN